MVYFSKDFLNPESKVSMPDIDMDFSAKQEDQKFTIHGRKNMVAKTMWLRSLHLVNLVVTRY